MDFIEQDLNAMLGVGADMPPIRSRVKGGGGALASKNAGTSFSARSAAVGSSSSTSRPIGSTIGGGNISSGRVTRAEHAKQSSSSSPSALLLDDASDWVAFNNRSKQVLTSIAHKVHASPSSAAVADHHPNGNANEYQSHPASSFQQQQQRQQLMAGGSAMTPINGSATSSEHAIRQFLLQNGGGTTRETVQLPLAPRAPAQPPQSTGTAPSLRHRPLSSNSRASRPLPPLHQHSSDEQNQRAEEGSHPREQTENAGLRFLRQGPPSQFPESVVPSQFAAVPTNNTVPPPRRLGTSVNATASVTAWGGTPSQANSGNSRGEVNGGGRHFTLSPLTIDLLTHVASFCDPKSLVRLGATSKMFYRVQETSALWRAMYFSYGVKPTAEGAASQGAGTYEEDEFAYGTVNNASSSSPTRANAKAKAAFASLKQAVIRHMVASHRELVEDLNSANDRFRNVEQRLQIRQQALRNQAATAPPSSSIAPPSTSSSSAASVNPNGGTFTQALAFRDQLPSYQQQQQFNNTNSTVNFQSHQRGDHNDSLAERQLAADVIILRRQVADMSNQIQQLHHRTALSSSSSSPSSLSETLENPSKALAMLSQFERIVVSKVVFGGNNHSSRVGNNNNSAIPTAITRGTETFQQLEMALLSLSTSAAASANLSALSIAVQHASNRWANVQRNLPLTQYYDVKDDVFASMNASSTRISQDSRRLLSLIYKLVMMRPDELSEYLMKR